MQESRNHSWQLVNTATASHTIIISSTECKILGNPKPIASTYAHADVSAHSAPSRRRFDCEYGISDYKILRTYTELTCTSREAPRFLALEQKAFRRQQLTCSFSLSGGAIKFASLCENYLLVLSTATKMA